MAYLYAHTRDLFRTVRDWPGVPADVAAEAARYADLEIDSEIPACAWLDLCGTAGRWPPELRRETDRRTRGGG